MIDFEQYKQVFIKATRTAAISSHKEMIKLHKEFPDPESRDYKSLGRAIDKAAVEAMQKVFETQSHFSIEVRGSEGRKDTRRDGIASPDLYGSYGPAGKEIVEIVNDAVEGTAFASRNIPGAASVLAASLGQKNGLSATGNFDYMSKLFGPPELKGKISLELSPSENIKIALKELGIKNPEDLAVVILDRPRNQFEIRSAQTSGVTTILIPGGDLVPALLAVLNPDNLKKIRSQKIAPNTKAVLLMGSGGWEEGVIAAGAAKATGGHAQAKIYSEDEQSSPSDKESTEQAKILEVEDLVPATSSSILISATPVTSDPWFGVSGANETSTSTILITESGFEIRRSD